MIAIKSKTVKALQNGEIKQSDFAQELIKNYPVSEIAFAFTELLIAKEAPVVDKIVISPEQFSQLFRIRGLDVNGQPSTRGRKRKDSK